MQMHVMTQTMKFSSIFKHSFQQVKNQLQMMSASLKGCAIIAFTDKVYNAIGATDF